MYSFKTTIINLSHVNVNNRFFYGKGPYIFQIKTFLLRMTLLYIFVKLFNV